MSVKIVVKKNTYFDSVSLMSISTRANKIDGVEQAFVAMATEMNKGVLKNLGLLTPELEAAKNGDLMIVINGQDGADNEQILAGIEALFSQKAQSGQHEARYATLASAKKTSSGQQYGGYLSQRTVRRPRSTTGVTKRSQRDVVFR